jgi:hypothetical protein
VAPFGAGGMGEVLKALERDSPDVAIKVSTTEFSESFARAEVRRRAESLQRLRSLRRGTR